MSEQVLYQTVKCIMDNEEFEPNGHDFGDWSETVTQLAGTPPEWRGQAFQALDRFHRGELTRLLASYLPEDAPPETIVEVEEEEPECPQLPPGVRPNPDLAATASPWLDHYIDFCKHWSPRSYPSYHEACGLWLLSTIAARRVGYHFGHRRYTNLYLMLAGVSSKFTKSGATTLAMEVLRRAGLDWLRAPDRTTPQALLTYMAGRTPENYARFEEGYKELVKLKYGFAAQRGWFYEEFGSGIAAMTQPTGYMADFRGLLREFYDCPPKYEYLTKTRGDEVIHRPYLSLVANLTPADLRRVAGRGAQIWSDGFLARFGFVVPPLDEVGRARYPDGELTIPDEITDPLRTWHERLGLPTVDEVSETETGSFLPGPVRLRLSSPPPITYYPIESEVKDLVYEYNLALLDLLPDILEDLEPSYVRLHQKALSIAVLLAALDRSDSVTLKYWARAQMVVEEWRVSLHRIYTQIKTPTYSETLEAALEDRIVDVVRKQGNPTAPQMRAYIKQHSTSQIEREADGMVLAGVLKVKSSTWGGRLIKKYSLSDEIENEKQETQN